MERPSPRPRPSLKARLCPEEGVDEGEREEDAAGVDVTVTVAAEEECAEDEVAEDGSDDELDATLVDAVVESRS